ncbi:MULTISPECIES: TadE/TadG family type IV pilus assembly protein [unclassified Streptomyces]|uniref:TadE/TadG family type IV pilus assembly protein n=1 Tax=unclassified Streptomyces TaxID=2593676 RepID=UPI0004CC8454|nr:TadE/TadG family type IV pilus assembly protein [Streptomyces sp. NRRL F-5135]
MLKRRPNGEADTGQAAIEYAGVLTLLIFVGLVGVQLGLVAYAAQQAGTAARAAARTASYAETSMSADAAAKAAVSGWLDAGIDDMNTTSEAVTVTARVKVPEILPVFNFGDAKRTSTMPRD